MSEQAYQVNDSEKGLYHVQFTRIVKVGKRTQDNNYIQKFQPKEWNAMTKGVGRNPASFDMGMSGITQFDEVKVIYDPTKQKPKANEETKAPAPKMGRPAKKDTN